MDFGEKQAKHGQFYCVKQDNQQLVYGQKH